MGDESRVILVLFIFAVFIFVAGCVTGGILADRKTNDLRDKEIVGRKLGTYDSNGKFIWNTKEVGAECQK